MVFANGGHERTAMLIVEHLWTLGDVRRWKPQPLDLSEIGGPTCVPDLLVETTNQELHIIECKAKRFITSEVQEKFDAAAEFLRDKGFGHHIWTNRDVLSSDTSHTVEELHRGRTYSAPAERHHEIASQAQTSTTLGDLLDRFGWDDTLSAAADAQFHFDFMKPLHENTPIEPNRSTNYLMRLFACRHENASWWDQLRTVED